MDSLFWIRPGDGDRKLRRLEDVYERYWKQMLLLAKSILHNQNDAEDVVHTVFLRIAQKHMPLIRSIEQEEDLRNYLLKATKNTALNLLKTKSRENVSLDTIAEFDLPKKKVMSDEEFWEYLRNRMDYEKMVRAIDSLPKTYREVLYYHFVVELTVKETAQLLNQSVGTTKKQLVRGKKLLLDLYEKGGNHGNRK